MKATFGSGAVESALSIPALGPHHGLVMGGNTVMSMMKAIAVMATGPHRLTDWGSLVRVSAR